MCLILLTNIFFKPLGIAPRSNAACESKEDQFEYLMNKNDHGKVWFLDSTAMLAVFALFLRANFGLDAGVASIIYSTFLGLVYFMPLFGGILADKFGYGKMVTSGISIMFIGYLLLSLPLGGNTLAMCAMLGSLLFIAVGTGLFKGNLQVMVGNLYDDPQYASKRDSAFSLFYMAINIGALFAPTAAVAIKDWAEKDLGFTGNDAYHFSFAVACVALIISMAIYFACRKWYAHVEGGKKSANNAAAQVEDNLTPAETKARIVALILVFAVVIFFWMAFHQNGLTLTYFADEFNDTSVSGLSTMLFDVWNLVLIIVAVYATFSVFQSNSAKGKLLSGLVGSGVLAFLIYRALGVQADATRTAPETALPFAPSLWNSENAAYTATITSTKFQTLNAILCKPNASLTVNSSAKNVWNCAA